MKKVLAVQITVDVRVEGEANLGQAVTALEALLAEVKKAQAEGRNVAAVSFLVGEEVAGEAEVVAETFTQDGEDETDLEEYNKAIEEAPVVILG